MAEQRQKTILECCPWVDDPMVDCYCWDLKSDRLKQAIYYCAKNFTECVIYQRSKEMRSH